MKTSKPFKTEDHLQSTDDIEEYLNAALEDGDEHLLLLALSTVAKATCGMGKLADQTNLNRESLYRVLSYEGNPRLDTLATLLKAFGLRLSVTKAA